MAAPFLVLLFLGAAVATEPRPFGVGCSAEETVTPPRGWNSYDSSPPWTQSSMANTEKGTLDAADKLASRCVRGWVVFVCVLHSVQEYTRAGLVPCGCINITACVYRLLPYGYDLLTVDSGWFGQDNLWVHCLGCRR